MKSKIVRELPPNVIVGVVGAGAMGAGIAQVAAAAGHPVILFDATPGAAQTGRDRIESGLVKLVSRGKKTEADVAKDMTGWPPWCRAICSTNPLMAWFMCFGPSG